MEITERIESRKDVKAISVRLLGDYKSVIIWRLGTSWVLIAISIILIIIVRMQNTSTSITTIRQQLLLMPAARMFVSQLLS